VKALFRIARKSSLWYLAAAIGLIAGIFIPSAAAKARSNYITASGTSLMLNGQPFQYIGFNTGMEGVCWDGNNWSTAQMDTYFSKLPPNGMTRIFAVRNAGTSIVGQVVTEAARYNQHLILALGDDNSNCSDTDGSPGGAGSGKTLAFYQGGWQGNYLSWVNTIVPMFANNPTVAMWEIANEPFHTGATNVDLATMESYVSGAAAAVRADDPNHLISVAPADTGDLGGPSNYTSVMSDPNINVLDFHDYAWDFENGAEESSNFSRCNPPRSSLISHLWWTKREWKRVPVARRHPAPVTRASPSRAGSLTLSQRQTITLAMARQASRSGITNRTARTAPTKFCRQTIP
jgi:hypothetical protein